MEIEEKAKEPTVRFTTKAGLPGAPQTKEVEVPQGDIKPWDLDSLAGFEQMGKPHPRLEGPLKVSGRARYTYDVKLPGMLYGRMIGAAIPAGEIVSVDTSKAEALPGVKAVWTAEQKTVRFAGQDVAAVAAVSPEIARGRRASGEGHVQGEAVRPRAARGDEARRAARLRRRREPGWQGAAAQRQRGRPRPGARRQPERPRRHREGLRRGRGHDRSDLLRARPHALQRSRPTASWLRGRANSSPSTPRLRASSRCARASPTRSSSTARTCA